MSCFVQILAVLVVTTIYSCFFSFAYVALIIGVAVLCIFTVPMAIVIWLITGSAFYASQRSYFVSEFIADLKEKYLKKEETKGDKDVANVLDEKKLDDDHEKPKDDDDAKADGKPPLPPSSSSSALEPIAEKAERNERHHEPELDHSDSEYTMVGSDDDDEDDSSDSESELGHDENGRERRKRRKNGKEKRKRGFLKKLFNIDKDKESGHESENEHEKGKEHEKLTKQKSKSLIRRFSSSSKSHKEKLYTA